MKTLTAGRSFLVRLAGIVALCMLCGTLLAPPSVAAKLDNPRSLSEELRDDLGMSLNQFLDAGELNTRAQTLIREFSAIPGFTGISMTRDNRLIVTGAGNALEGAAGEAGLEFHSTAVPLAPMSASERFEGDLSAFAQTWTQNFGATGVEKFYRDVDGQFVAVTFADAMPNTGAEEFADRYGNVAIRRGNELEPARPWIYVLPGGHGLVVVDDKLQFPGLRCSVGFAAWNPEGESSYLTAGHCGLDGHISDLAITEPVTDLTPADDENPVIIFSGVSSMAFSQFGGRNNAPNEVGTDVAAIDLTTDQVGSGPTVMTWESTEDVTEGAVPVTGVGVPISGAPVCKSGRTTGWSCGRVTIPDVIVPVRGFNYPGAQLDPNAPSDPQDFRLVRSFEMETSENYPTKTGAAPGDSGGPIISGNMAIGSVSSGFGEGGDVFYGARLDSALAALPDGYALKMFLSDPTLSYPQDGATIAQGDSIAGKVEGAPEGTSVEISGTINGNKLTKTIPVSQDGTWSMNAPNETGSLLIDVTAVNGRDRSYAARFSFQVGEVSVPNPVILNPEQYDTLTRVDTYSGTGIPGATVSVRGDGLDGTQNTTVGEDGSWNVKVTEPVSYSFLPKTIEARQGPFGGQPASAWVTRNFYIKPPVPVITSPVDGQEIAEGTASITLEGTTEVDGKITVQVCSANNVITTDSASGLFSVDLDLSQIDLGDCRIRAYLSIDGVDSGSSSVDIRVVTPVSPTPSPTDTPTETSSPTVTSTPTAEPSPSPTGPTPTPTEVPTPTQTPTITQTPTPQPTSGTPSAPPTTSPPATLSASPSAAPTETSTPAPVVTPSSGALPNTGSNAPVPTLVTMASVITGVGFLGLAISTHQRRRARH